MTSQASTNTGSFILSEMGRNEQDADGLASSQDADEHSGFGKLFVFDQKDIMDDEMIRIDQYNRT